MNARTMMTMNGPSRLEASRGPRSWLAAVVDWSLLMRRMRGAQVGEARFGVAKFRETGAADALPRRRRDRHPDAPPRRPLLASRDLPPAPKANILAGPLGNALALPRAPEPMSDTQIAQLMATATARPITIPIAPHMPAGPALPNPAPGSYGFRSPRVTPDRLPLPCESGNARLPDRPDMDATAVEAALAKALATLRKLAEQAQANRRR